jgi:hypothetical protein
MACDMLYNQSLVPNKVNLGEVTALPADNNTRYIFCSIVQAEIKNLLAVDASWAKDYHIINVRRRNKVAQYISWCVFRAQTRSGIGKHSPDWSDYKGLLPWKSNKDDIERFITEQHLDFAFNYNEILYYEDLAKSGLQTKYKKNTYPVTPEQIVTDYKLVNTLLEKYSYDGR